MPVLVEVTVDVLAILTPLGAISANQGFVEFKIEGDVTGEKATGRLGADNPNKSFPFQFEDGEHIWFWWDTLCGVANLQITVNREVVFRRLCRNDFMREIRASVTAIRNYPDNVYKTTGNPRLIEPEDRDRVTDIVL